MCGWTWGIQWRAPARTSASQTQLLLANRNASIDSARCHELARSKLSAYKTLETNSDSASLRRNRSAFRWAAMSVSTIKVPMKPVSILSLCASLLLLPGTAPGEETGTRRHLTLPTPVALEVPQSPTPVKMNGRQCLVYELHLTNFFTNRLELMRVEVLGD